MDRIDEIERVLTEACDKAIADGWGVRPDVTVEPANRLCCPIGACYATGLSRDPFIFASGRSIGMNDSAAAAFVAGFDAEDWGAEERDSWYDLGAKFRSKYVEGVADA